MSELKACPFCGGEAEVNSFPGTRFKPAVSCKSCPAETIARTVEEAILGWNRRPEPPTPVEPVKQFLDNWFAPWGSWKTEWWEGLNDVEFTDHNALLYLRKLVTAPPVSLLDGEGEGSGQPAAGGR